VIFDHLRPSDHRRVRP